MYAGVIGSGPVGQSIASGLANLGYSVTIGTRDPAKLADWAKGAGSKIQVGTMAQAGAAPLVFLCTKWDGTQSALKLAGADTWKGTVLVDVTNPLDFSAGPPPKIAVAYPQSGAGLVQSWAPGTKVVKAFNIVPARYMIDARLQEGTADLVIAGDDAAAKAQVTEIAKAWHWGSVQDMGGLGQAYWVECFALIWIHLGFRNNHWTHAFKLMRQ
jgi:8-hydroxy-5-deazaflavin:NADPH oxidoreductase